MKDRLIIGSRGSRLAIAQSEIVKTLLLSHFPSLQIEIQKIQTSGDKLHTEKIYKFGGKGVFVKEIEEALLSNSIDLAVHSMKDVPTDIPPALEIASILKREDASDAFLSVTYERLEDMPKGSRIGSSSLRRHVQILERNPNVDVCDLRGNVDTRLKKLDNDEYDAIILATAGLNRLGLRARIQSHFSVETFTPAIGQGAMGVECRSDDIAIKKIVQCLHHEPTALCVAAERAVNQVLKGDCHSPIGAYAYIAHAQLHLHAMVGSLDGKIILNTYQCGDVSDAVMLGELAAKQLLKDGAATLLRE